MRIRVRGPEGQSIVNIDETATVDELKRLITTETSLHCYDIKYGYPPKVLELDPHSPSTTLKEIGVRLNGEQLLVSRKDAASSSRLPTARSQQTEAEKTKKAQTPAKHLTKGETAVTKPHDPVAKSSSSATGFSFGDIGTAPPPKTSPKQAPIIKEGKAQGPLLLNRKGNPDIMNDAPEIILPEQGGTLVLRVMPDDNSCLFRAISNAIMPGLDAMNELRSVIAQTIQANPSTYSKVVLDNKDPDVYCTWIQGEDAWGGQIELDILSKHFDLEICSIDVQTLRVDRYNEGRPTRCIVVYSGIHYDTIALSPFDLPPEEDRKIFRSADPLILEEAVVLCQKLQQKHYFTDTAGFKITCNDCGAVCIGEAGATEHCSKTGHYSFGEAA